MALRHKNAIDLTGQRFGRLLALRENGRIRNSVAWECRCDCGTVKTVDGSSLRHRTAPVRSCGCLLREAQTIDLTGIAYGRWTVIKRDMSKKGCFWLCRCECGSEKSIASNSLRVGQSTSCGCKRKESTQSKCREYAIWRGMLSRCENPANAAYARYGGRGIAVCKQWHSFDAFLEDVGPRPSANHSLDRIDPNGGYEPTNVRWSDWKTQANNRALSEQRVIRVLDEIEALISDNETVDSRAVVSMVRSALLGI